MTPQPLGGLEARQSVRSAVPRTSFTSQVKFGNTKFVLFFGFWEGCSFLHLDENDEKKMNETMNGHCFRERERLKRFDVKFCFIYCLVLLWGNQGTAGAV